MTKTAIEWTEETWNPVTGCTKVSPGCDHCYAERITNRWGGPGAFDTVVLHPERLDTPMRRKKPTMWFVNSMSDLFHNDVPEHFIFWVFDRMRDAPQHTFQILTKRPGRMASVLSRYYDCDHGGNPTGTCPHCAPFSNVWLGVSVEDQKWTDVRIPKLIETPAAVRFLSVEPLLGALDLSAYLGVEWMDSLGTPGTAEEGGWGREMFSALKGDRLLDWVIVGGESGSGARPMDPAWARSLRDQCHAAEVPFFFKQWGGRTPKAGGRELDGRTWDEMPARNDHSTNRTET
jgi:protein gp37